MIREYKKYDKNKVLVLSRNREAMHYVSIEDALLMILAERAQPCGESVIKTLHSVRQSFDVPYVIVTEAGMPKQLHNVAFSSKNVFIRDSHTCQYCGTVGGALTMEHVFPKSRGGTNDWTNVVTACNLCNNRKTNRTPAEAGMVLRTKPRRPTRNANLRGGLTDDQIHPDLRPYLYVKNEAA